MTSGVKTIPKNTHRLYLSFGYAPGPIQESPIANEAFLNSYLEVGVWLRAVTASEQVAILRAPSSSTVQRMSALANFYQQAGLQAEDAISNLVAWSIWARDRNRNLADLLRRISLRFSIPAKPVGREYHESVWEEFDVEKKQINIYPREYLQSLVNIQDIEIPARLGIRWKPDPSVKDVSQDQRKIWKILPRAIREFVGLLIDDRSDLLTSCYNKLKHGPQLIFADPATSARNRGHPAHEIGASVSTIRLLLQGSRVQETEAEFASSKRVAPFLYGDGDNARRWLHQSILYSSHLLFIVGTWVNNFAFANARREMNIEDPYVLALLKERTTYLDRVFPTDVKLRN